MTVTPVSEGGGAGQRRMAAWGSGSGSGSGSVGTPRCPESLKRPRIEQEDGKTGRLFARKHPAAFTESFRRIVQGMFSQSPDTLAEFGLKPPKASKKTVAVK